MRPPKPPNPPIPPELLSELIAPRPYIEHILCDGSRDPRVREAAENPEKQPLSLEMRA